MGWGEGGHRRTPATATRTPLTRHSRATHTPLTHHARATGRFVKRIESYSVQGERPYMEDEFSMRLVTHTPYNTILIRDITPRNTT